MVDDDRDRPGYDPFDDDLDDFDSATAPADASKSGSGDPSKAGWSTTPSDPTEAVRIITSNDEAPMSFGADDTGPMPHWTAPPTGELPKLNAEGDAGDGTSWADELTGENPIWDTRSTVDPSISPLGFNDDDDELAPAEPAPALRFDDRPTNDPEQRVTTIRTQRPPRQPARPREDAALPGAARAGAGGRNLPVAIGVGLAIAAVYLALSKAGPRYLVGLVMVILGIAAAELYESQRKAGYQPATFIGIAACAAMPFVTYWRGHDGITVVLFASVVATMLWLLLSGTLDSAPMPNASATMLGIVYVGLLGSYAGLILRERHGVGTMFTLALATVGYDTVGLLAGSAVGRSPLIRWVSPNKTVEGLCAGMAASAGLVFLAAQLGHVAPWNDRVIHTIQLMVVIAIAAPIGDLVESMLKRSLGVKDMGDLLPAHGGVLDRFDAFLFVLPAVYYLGLLLNVPVGVR